MAELVKAAGAALCVAGRTCAFDTVGKPLPASGQARTEIFDGIMKEKVRQLLGEPIEPDPIFGKLDLQQIEQRIRVLEVLRFEGELEAKRLSDVDPAKRVKIMEAYSEGQKFNFNIDQLDIAKHQESFSRGWLTKMQQAKRLLQDPTAALTVTTTSGTVPVPDTFMGRAQLFFAQGKEKAQAFLATTGGKATVGIGAVALIWLLTRGD